MIKIVIFGLAFISGNIVGNLEWCRLYHDYSLRHYVALFLFFLGYALCVSFGCMFAFMLWS